MAAPLAIISNALTSLLASAAVDAVGVFSQDFQQVFPRARPIKVVVKEDSKVMEHPLETGASVVDHRIILPIEIELSLIVQAEDYRDAYQQIRQLFLIGQLLVVQTRAGVYENQLISSMPHEEDPEMYDALTIALKLKEAQFAQVVATTAPKNAPTTKRGTQQGMDASTQNTSKTSLLYRIFN